MIRVVIAEDHPIVREGIKCIVNLTGDIQVVGEVADGAEVIPTVRNTPCDLLLLDFSLPNKNGLEILGQLRSESAQVPALVLSVHSEAEYGARTLRAGAAGYLTKDSSTANLVNAIRRVARGGKYLSAELAERLAFGVNKVDRNPSELLSDREYQVMTLIASGVTVSEIASQLSLSVKTISTYRTRVLEKLELKNNAELTRYALKEGLVA